MNYNDLVPLYHKVYRCHTSVMVSGRTRINAGQKIICFGEFDDPLTKQIIYNCKIQNEETFFTIGEVFLSKYFTFIISKKLTYPLTVKELS